MPPSYSSEHHLYTPLWTTSPSLAYLPPRSCVESVTPTRPDDCISCLGELPMNGGVLGCFPRLLGILHDVSQLSSDTYIIFPSRLTTNAA